MANNCSFRQYIMDSIESYKSKRKLPIYQLMKWLDNKRYSQSFAKKLGVRVPKHLGSWSDVDAVPWTEMPDLFVLKPQWGSSNNGVFLLNRQSNDTWYDSMRKKTFHHDGIVEEYNNEIEKYKSINKPVMAEERFVQKGRTHSVPLDYKMYAFNGRVELIMQRNVNGGRFQSEWKFAYFDRNWNILESPRTNLNYESNIIPPKSGNELVETAENISKVIPLPFTRIDLYDTEVGIGFGEITPHPGSYKLYTPKWDKILGDAWSRSLKQIGNRNAKAEELLNGHLCNL